MKPAADLPNWKAFAAGLRNAVHKQQTASKSQMLMHERLRHWRNLQLLVRFFSIGCVFVLLLVFFTPPIPAAGLRTDEVRVAAIAGTVLLAGALSHLMARYSVEASPLCLY